MLLLGGRREGAFTRAYSVRKIAGSVRFGEVCDLPVNIYTRQFLEHVRDYTRLL